MSASITQADSPISTSAATPAAEAKSSFMARLRAFVQARPLLVAAYIVLIVASAVLRLASYDRFLPFIDYTDEGVYMALAQEMRGLSTEDAIREKYGNLPPLYTVFNRVVQDVYDIFKPHNWNIPAEYYVTLRLISVWMGVFTVIAIAAIGYYVSGHGAALIAGSVWAFSPLVVAYNMLAIPDPATYLFTALTLLFALMAWHHRSFRYALLSLLSAIIVIYAKYWILTIVLPFMLVTGVLLWHYRRAGDGRWRVWLGVLFIIAAASGLYFVLVVDPLGSGGERFSIATEGNLTELMFDAARLDNNWRHSIFAINYNPLQAAWILAIGIGAWLLALRLNIRAARGRFVWLLAGYAALTLPLTAGVSFISADEKMRSIYPMSIAILPLYGAALMQIIWVLQGIFKQHIASRFSLSDSVQRGLAFVIVAAVLALPVASALPIYVTENTRLIQLFEREHVVNVVRAWFDGSPPNDGLVINPSPSDLDRVWNRIWGAYDGSKPFVWWGEQPDDILQNTPESYVARGITYLMLNDNDLAGKYGTPAMLDYIDQLYHVKTISVQDGDLAGNSTHVWRLLPPQYEASFDYGDEINLVGYDLSAQTLAAGEALTLRPYWTIDRQPTSNYSLFIHLYGADDTDIRAQHDGVLLMGSERLTLTWTDTDEVYFGEPITFSLPADLPAGDYRLALGVYDFTTFARLTNPTTGADFATIDITVR